MRCVFLKNDISELGISSRPADLDGIGRAVTVLCNNYLSHVLLGIRSDRVALRVLVVFVAVEEDDNVRVLLDRARLTKVAGHRTLICSSLGGTRELRAADNGNVKLLRHYLERTGHITYLLRSVLYLLIRLHKLEIVDNNETEVINAAELRLHCGYRDTGGIVDKYITSRERGSRLSDVIPLLGLELTRTERIAVDECLT